MTISALILREGEELQLKNVFAASITVVADGQYCCCCFGGQSITRG
jgi:hypothetical protein